MLHKWGFEPVQSKSFNRSPIELIKDYKNDEVIELFMSSFNVSKEGAEEIFSDLLIWMWGLAGRIIEGKSDIPLMLREEFFALEKMWRCFALFTEDYRDFCMNHLGVHLDFRDSTDASDPFNEFYKSNSSFVSIHKRRSEQLSFIAVEFGEEVLNRWLLKYPEIYSKESLTRDKS
jgi:hypothetical protein